MEDRTERGLWNGGIIHGYRSDPDDPGKLIIDPEWAAIVRTHFFDAFALREIDDEGRKLASKIDIARHRLTRVQAEIQNLLQVLKHMGKAGLASVGDELKELEQERGTLKSQIKEMTEQESPLKRVSDAARDFIENWRDIGEILEEAEPDEKRCILHHFIQSLVLKFIDAEEKRAEYSLILFPEVGPAHSRGGNESGTPTKLGDSPDVLTANAKLRHNGEKAPRKQPSS